MQSNVGTCTLLFSTRTVINASKLGMTGSVETDVAEEGKAPFVGVAGGDGSGFVGAGPH